MPGALPVGVLWGRCLCAGRCLGACSGGPLPTVSWGGFPDAGAAWLLPRRVLLAGLGEFAEGDGPLHIVDFCCSGGRFRPILAGPAERDGLADLSDPAGRADRDSLMPLPGPVDRDSRTNPTGPTSHPESNPPRRLRLPRRSPSWPRGPSARTTAGRPGPRRPADTTPATGPATRTPPHHPRVRPSHPGRRPAYAACAAGRTARPEASPRPAYARARPCTGEAPLLPTPPPRAAGLPTPHRGHPASRRRPSRPRPVGVPAPAGGPEGRATAARPARSEPSGRPLPAGAARCRCRGRTRGTTGPAGRRCAKGRPHGGPPTPTGRFGTHQRCPKGVGRG